MKLFPDHTFTRIIEEKDVKIMEGARRLAELQHDQEHWRDQVSMDATTC